MNVCGENPIMELLDQAYRKHRSWEAFMEPYQSSANQILFFFFFLV